MKTIKLQWLLMCSLVISVVLVACNSNTAEKKAEGDAANAAAADDPVKRGEYLVMVSGCNHCHSPKVFDEHGAPRPDPTKLLSGRPADAPIPSYDPKMVAPGQFIMCSQDLTTWFGPWGVSFARNLTPDSATGIGAINSETFKSIIRSGKHMGASAGRPIMPPMPWEDIAKMTDKDLDDIHAYLMSLKPISNNVPEYIPPAGPPPGSH